ncbi:hypothetical protein CC79DRAFT_439766 [Sarocladium strictum]
MASITDARIRVRVGETVFHTTKATLIESRLFASLFDLPPPADNEYFIDNDPELFAHILRYLRTKTYPLFYDRINGHDKTKYVALLQQAEYYQLGSLASWISQKKFLQAVRKTTKHFSHQFVGPGQLSHMTAYWGKDEELTVISAVQSRQRKIMCPAGIWAHDGNTQPGCAQQGCFKKSFKRMDPVNTTVLDVEGILTTVEVLGDELRRAHTDSSGVIVAAMQQPPPYAAETSDTPLPTSPVPPRVGGGGFSAAGRSGHGGMVDSMVGGGGG